MSCSLASLFCIVAYVKQSDDDDDISEAPDHIF